MTELDSSSFGPNLWLMQEMHDRYLADETSVSEAWREFFEDYLPHDERPGTHELRTAEPAGPDSVQERAAGAEEEPPGTRLLTRADAVLASRMHESLEVPTATSVRVMPAKLLEVNRGILNNHQQRSWNKKVSFTHFLAFAIVKALAKMPGMNTSYADAGGKPHAVEHEHVNLGLAVDVPLEDGSRTLLVPNIKAAETLSFKQFFSAYDDLLRRVRNRKLSVGDLEGTTATITNPGMFGTVQSIPRLMKGQSVIVGIGSIDFPAEYQGADPGVLADLGVGKVLTLTSTYDHRVIQGALSGEFLAQIQRYLLGEEEFYEEIFASMGVPYVPVKWRTDRNPTTDPQEMAAKQARVLQLINIYRVRGHLIADLDPLDATPPRMPPELDPATFGFTIWDLERMFATGTLAGPSNMSRRSTDRGRFERLGEILRILRDAYCRTVGIEYMHISAPEEKAWIQNRVEGVTHDLPSEDQSRIMQKLNEAESFETFLHTKYVGHKRFSLEGALSLIPMLDALLDSASRSKLEEAVIGMAHRGRLNVLANIVGKSHRQIFKEFEGNIDPTTVHGSGDVKYHLGAEGTYAGPEGRTMPVSVASNPSHLEAVDPVVEGIVRAKQEMLNRPNDWSVLPVLIHGDAAFAGQGVVAETLNLSQLRGYRTGGTVHIIVNNQVGFTATAGQTRSSMYASDVAKMIQAPIFHVNGDDPEACVRVARLAFDFRQAFRKDAVIDMVCYRKWGHNETDEPSYTQPVMYRQIANRRSVRKLYTESLLHRGHITMEDAETVLEDYRRKLQSALDESRYRESEPVPDPGTEPLVEPSRRATAVGIPTLNRILETITAVPAGFNVHPKLEAWLKVRSRALVEDRIDWSVAEALALGSLLLDGISVRLAGQDTRRGTFSQRHSVLIDQQTGAEHIPLAVLARDGVRFNVYDSLLSEFAALGFEYGYSVAATDSLTVWEAQFGDFANGAQVIVDQFIAAGEEKWDQRSNLVMLLPHGYEGQGPEHSSARLERFLNLGAQENFRVAVPSTPANYFHLLIRQGKLPIRKPLVCLTPKSLLRLPAAVSGVIDVISGSFRPVLGDSEVTEPESVRRVILCSGKVHYDLAAARRRMGAEGVALIRLEQLYPFPADELEDELHNFNGAELMWVQEEPENMGAWRYLQLRLAEDLKLQAVPRTRPASASPASGSAKLHEQEQQDLIGRALAGLGD